MHPAATRPQPHASDPPPLSALSSYLYLSHHSGRRATPPVSFPPPLVHKNNKAKKISKTEQATDNSSSCPSSPAPVRRHARQPQARGGGGQEPPGRAVRTRGQEQREGAARAGRQPPSQAARQPPSRAARQPASQAARQPGSQPSRQPCIQDLWACCTRLESSCVLILRKFTLVYTPMLSTSNTVFWTGRFWGQGGSSVGGRPSDARLGAEGGRRLRRGLEVFCQNTLIPVSVK